MLTILQPKMTYKFNTAQSESLQCCFCVYGEIDKLNLKCISKQRPRIAETILKNKKLGDLDDQIYIL